MHRDIKILVAIHTVQQASPLLSQVCNCLQSRIARLSHGTGESSYTRLIYSCACGEEGLETLDHLIGMKECNLKSISQSNSINTTAVS